MSEALETTAAHLGPPGYRLEQIIGQGATGVVYRAVGPTAEPVALKIARDYQLAVIGHMRAEVAQLKRTNHPGIVSLRDSGVVRGLPWYAMDLLPARTLADRCAEHCFDLEPAIEMLARLLEILDAIHARGFLHGDLKPENIFLKDEATPIIGDLDLIREGTRAASLGTPLYAAPEQIRTEPLDARTDIYALGCIAYMLLRGEPPFSNPSTLLVDHLQSPPPSLDVPVDVSILFKRMLAKRRQDRPAYARDVLSHLTRWLNAPDIPPARPPHLYQPTLQGRRNLLQAFRRFAGFKASGAGYLIAGDTGIGKTAMAERLSSLLADQGWRTVPAIAGPANPLASMKSLLQMMVDVAWIGGPDLAQRMFGADGGTLRHYQPNVGEVPGVGAETMPPPTPRTSSARTSRSALFRDLERALRVLAEEQRIALIIDDLHLADELTLAFFASVLREDLFSAGVLFIGFYRPEHNDAIATLETARGGGFIELSLDSLTDAEISRMVADMLACEAPPPELIDTLQRDAHGNPFYVTEYLRLVVERGVLQRIADDWEMTAALPPAPDSLQTLLTQRLDSLTLDGREMLEIAALIGRSSPPELLQEASTVAPEAAQTAIEELLRTRFLGLNPAQQLRFRHEGLRHHILSGLDNHPERSARIANALERQFFGHAEFPELFQTIADHWRDAGDAPTACAFYQRAGDRAMQLAAYRHAEDHYGRAAALVPASETARCGQLLVRLAIAQSSGGRLDQAGDTILEALRSLGARIPTTRGGWRRALTREVLLRIMTPFTGAAGPEEPIDDLVRAAAYMAERYYFANDLLKLYTMALMSVNAGNRIEDAANARPYAYLGFAVGTMRLERRALQHLNRSRAVAQRRNEPADIAYAWLAEALTYAGRGDWISAQHAALAGLDEIDEQLDPVGFENLTSCMSHLAYYQGAPDESVRYARQARLVAEQRGNEPRQAWAWVFEARAELLLGHTESAAHHLELATALGGQVTDGFLERTLPGLSALAAVHLGDRDASLRYARLSLGRLSGSWATNFATREGYLATASAFRRLGDSDGERRTVAELGRFGWLFPMAAPLAKACRARLRARPLSERGRSRLLHTVARRGALPDELMVRQWHPLKGDVTLADPELAQLRIRLVAPPDSTY